MLSTTTSRVLRRYTSRPGAQRASAIPGLTASSCRRSLSTHAFLPAALPKSSKSGVISHCRASGYATAARETFATKRVSATRIPSEADMDAAELDAELLPAEEIALQMSDRAAERIRTIAQREGPSAALRISVESGGCHGYQYKLELADASANAPEDYILQHPSISPSNLLIDAVSLPLLNGSTVDFATELIGSAFRVIANPNATGKGCGCGVSWELKL